MTASRSLSSHRPAWTCLGLLTAALAVPVSALERLEPPRGCYFGMNLGQDDNVEWLRARLGLTPAVYVQFFHFPFTERSRQDLNVFLDQVRPTRGIALITLEPFQGLETITADHALELARHCATNEASGLGGIMIRFAHEMNGNWYPWCQQPARYKDKFRLLAGIVHTNTTRTAMLWAPHNGIGYPFATNLYQAAPGSPDFLALDTNGDGRLTAHDDMYEPYYPGDDAVDWVGMTLYHWGAEYPWRENEMPPANIFASTLTGAGHEPPIPDFYARYCADGVHEKPLAIPETAAFFNPQQPSGPGEFLIKQAWWQQVFNAADENTNSVNIATDLPKLKCINWFDHYKPEAEAGHDWIDWRISAQPNLRRAFIDHVRAPRNGRPYFLTAPEFDCWRRQAEDCILSARLPRIAPLTGPLTVSVTTQARTNCDVVVDVLDHDFRWHGGARASVAAGTHSVTLYVTIEQERALTDGLPYRWSLFLTPPGGDYQEALAWYDTPGPVARAARPAIQIVGSPPVITPGSNIMVKVHYTSAALTAAAQVNLLDEDYQWHGGQTTIVPRGDGLLDVTVMPQPTLTHGIYTLECFLSDSPTNWRNVMARSDHRLILVTNDSAEDSMQTQPHPAYVRAGEVFRFFASYSASADRDLHIDLLDDEGQFVAGTVQRVGASSGVQALAIGHPEATPGIYRVNAFMTAPGQPWTNALAWSDPATVIVLPQSYLEWAGWRWGIVLGSDRMLPGEDADGDGMSNDAERIAHTAPLDPRDLLRLDILFEEGQFMLRWRSAPFRRYQLHQRNDWRADTWRPWGQLMDGTGETLTVPMGALASEPPTFYRLEVLE